MDNRSAIVILVSRSTVPNRTNGGSPFSPDSSLTGPYAPLRIARAEVDECNGEWLLKNSLARNPQKFHRDRMPYK